MPVTLASCLGLTSDALGACPHDYTVDTHIMSIFIYSRRKDTKSFGILSAFGGKSAKRRSWGRFS